jgi:RHS repeat-associated protein
MQMPNRTYSANNYRYGFNGKENDNEVKGTGNQQDYGMRVYDSRLGRFLTVDPLMPDYPFYSPYQFAGNKPIVAADLDGLEEWMKTQENALRRQAELKVQKGYQNRATIQPYNPGDRTWVQKWRDSKNFLLQWTYGTANGIYTLTQQLTSGVTQQEYIENMGGGAYRSKGSGSERQRLENFVNGATVFVPGSPGAQSVKGLGFADDAMRLAANAGDDALKFSAYEIAANDGTHAGFLTRYLDATVLQLERGITSIEKNINDHLSLLKDPKKYFQVFEKGDWEKLDPRQQKHLIEVKWPGDIKRGMEQKSILQEILNQKK